MNRIVLDKIEQFEKDERRAELLRRLVIPEGEQRRNEKIELLESLRVGGGGGVSVRSIDALPALPTPTSEPPKPKSWKQVRITFISDHALQATIDGDEQPRQNYEEMGFKDRRTGAPRRAWTVLRELSGNAREYMGMDKKRAQEIRAALHKQFPTIPASSPALEYKKGSGYRPAFDLDRSPAFDA